MTKPNKPIASGKKPAVKKAATKRQAVKAAPKHPLMLDGKDWNRSAVIEFVCDKIATSSKSMGTILLAGYEGLPLPNYSTVMRWVDEDEALCKIYARAREGQADFMADEFAEIHEKAWVPILLPDGQPLMVNGKPLRTVDKASAVAARLEADNKKWLMSKLKPKKYGDKLDVTADVTVSTLTDDQLRAKATALSSKLGIAFAAPTK